ncbi:hypothetical protein BCR36DRAFT_129223 [Piromyces finnis]|uniref:Uncharacterized protein n=1 Tax=Piromyces finnis TaxID=1754191 RepID=A0A1Y1V0A6_9FUNG|nr:hypothetical protein BCR36DRAFT_129223 [Piromyces finnis]|eukprot:ORX44392.1 hypothetical protein BCR36DRAFT_129223 [Piromyces finnis]
MNNYKDLNKMANNTNFHAEDEIYSACINLNDSSQYINNPSTSISLIPISNNISIVSSNKPTITKSSNTAKRWGGSITENLSSNTDNVFQTPPSSATSKAHASNCIPPLNNPPASSMGTPLGQLRQSGAMASLDKKLNENRLVNNNAKIKAYVVNSAYSNSIVTPSGTNNIKEKLSAMAYMNEDNPELNNPLNGTSSTRRKSNTTIPSSSGIKPSTHQSSQSIDYKSFSLSKKKIYEKLNE